MVDLIYFFSLLLFSLLNQTRENSKILSFSLLPFCFLSFSLNPNNGLMSGVEYLENLYLIR